MTKQPSAACAATDALLRDAQLLLDGMKGDDTIAVPPQADGTLLDNGALMLPPASADTTAQVTEEMRAQGLRLGHPDATGDESDTRDRDMSWARAIEQAHPQHTVHTSEELNALLSEPVDPAHQLTDADIAQLLD